MSATAIVYTLIVVVSNTYGGVAPQVVADYPTLVQCEDAKKSAVIQLQAYNTRATAACVAVPSFTN